MTYLKSNIHAQQAPLTPEKLSRAFDAMLAANPYVPGVWVVVSAAKYEEMLAPFGPKGPLGAAKRPPKSDT